MTETSMREARVTLQSLNTLLQLSFLNHVNIHIQEFKTQITLFPFQPGA